jgi:hypothetical protein
MIHGIRKNGDIHNLFQFGNMKGKLIDLIDLGKDRMIIKCITKNHQETGCKGVNRIYLVHRVE